MARRHVKQLDLANPKWTKVTEDADPLDDSGFIQKGLSKMLCSIDERTGAQTNLIKAEAGWKDEKTIYHHFLEELYVLKGKIKIGNNVFTEGCYSYNKHSAVHGPFEAIEDTIAILYVDAPVREWLPGAGKKQVDFLDVKAMPWEKYNIQCTPGGVEDVPDGVWGKLINEDAETGARIMHVKFDKGWEEPYAHYHSFNEEGLVTKGTLDMDEFIWPTMFYAFRPPGIIHCPLKLHEEAEFLVRADGWQEYGSWRFDNFHLHRDSPWGFDKIAEDPIWRKRYG